MQISAATNISLIKLTSGNMVVFSIIFFQMHLPVWYVEKRNRLQEKSFSFFTTMCFCFFYLLWSVKLCSKSRLRFMRMFSSHKVKNWTQLLSFSLNILQPNLANLSTRHSLKTTQCRRRDQLRLSLCYWAKACYYVCQTPADTHTQEFCFFSNVENESQHSWYFKLWCSVYIHIHT